MVDEKIDAQGMMCPMPIVQLTKKMKTMSPGQTLELVADDVGALEDVPAWVSRTGNEMLEQRQESGKYYFVIKKK
ncbi:MAG: sulfurtransferase TusA family protein [Candidatus Methanomethylophilaceae archaeon]|nr:sulfurtransferase TusA family protein [Candidatus Methanomethylophilaceae archaeon]